MNRIRAGVVAWLLLMFVGSQVASAAATAELIGFSPRGTVRDVRQVTARFSVSMVALGDPRLPDPFNIDCPASGKGRWADPTNWVYDFDEDLPAGLRCRFRLRDDLRTADGRAVAPAAVAEFDTGGPAIRASLPREGSYSVDERQVFILKLDAPALADSITANSYCAVDGLAEQILVELVVGDEREHLLAARQQIGFDRFWLLWKDGVVGSARVRNPQWQGDEDDLVVLRCRRTLPPATRVELVWGSGVSTSSGLKTRQEQRLAFRVRPAFTASVACSRSNARGGCLPMLPITVRFSAPVPRAQAMALRLRASDGTLFSPKSEQEAAAVVEQVMFEPPFPSRSTLVALMPDGLQDDSGRTLENAARFPLDLRIDAFPPLAKFAAKFGILEAGEGGVLPVSLRNLDPRPAGEKPAASSSGQERAAVPARSLKVANDPTSIAEWLRRVDVSDQGRGEWVDAEPSEDESEEGNGRDQWREETGNRSVFTDDDRPKAFEISAPSGAMPMEVVGIPLEGRGLHVVELESRLLGESLLGRPESRFVASAALVTNLSVHFKWGRERSLVWVTSLDQGEPVANAEVGIVSYCTGRSLWQGRTNADGIASVDAELGSPHGSSYCPEDDDNPPLLISATTADDFSFNLSSWADGIGPSQFGLPQGGPWELMLVHSVLDRALFRAGEIVSMQHYLRRHDMQGVQFGLMQPGPHKVVIRHDGSGQEFSSTVDFRADGTADQQWPIPADAKLGEYSITIEDEEGQAHYSGSFRVEEYRLPSMRASVTGPAAPLVRAKQADLDLHVAYLSGGGASGMAVKLRTLVEQQPQHFADYADYEFGGEPVKVGRFTQADGDGDESGDDSATGVQKAQVMPVTLDAAGSARVSVSDLPDLRSPARLVAELEYADANGEILTTSSRIRLLPSALSVGIRREGWVASPEQVRFKVVVLDLDGKPKAKQKVDVALYSSESYSYRKRMIGGFYTYDTTTETQRLPVSCEGRTDKQGLLSCEVAPGVSGQVLIRAETSDKDGNSSGATSSVWVVGDDDWWFGGTAGDRMDLLPERKDYESGERARLQVRVPFRKATALVTVEREGVLSGFVTRLRGRKPVVDVPIEDRHAPNVFVSVLAVRGRVPRAEPKRDDADTEITGLVDLRKPAYRLGMAEIKVGWKPHRLDVKVQPDRSEYRVRDTARISLKVARADGRPLPPDTELALAAVDEALLELSPNPSWKLLDAMMGERGLEVWTSTAQMQVVGKRHYGRKAVPHGGGGGREGDRAREQFDSLLLWSARVKVDADGPAKVDVPLNDSLSSFRIVAIAHAEAGLFGTGSASVATTQDLILVSGLPPVVREGDRFDATFTVRNTTRQPLDVTLDAAVEPAPDGEALAAQSLRIGAGEARDVRWSVTVPVDHPALKWDVRVQGTDPEARDRMKIEQKVIPAFPVRTYQATITQLTQPWSMPAALPAGAIAGRGGLEVMLQDKLGGSLDGVREYMQWYPYVCLEQNLSRAVALRDRSMWDAWMARLPVYMDGDGLLRYFPTDRLQGDDTLTAYVMAIADEAGWPLGESNQQKLSTALKRFVAGKLRRDSALATADLGIRKLAAINALSRYGDAKPGMLDSLRIEPNLWPTSALIDWAGILKRVPKIDNAAAQRKTALGLLRARLNFQGTVMGFSTERSDGLWWLMVSGDSNANRMLLTVMNEADWEQDIPRLVRGSLFRQHFGHWNTTVANAWGVMAMEKFSAAFESTPVTGETVIDYGDQSRTQNWDDDANEVQADAKDWTERNEVDLPTEGVQLPWQPGEQMLSITHQGEGRPWAMVRATAALPLEQPLFTGFSIKRSVTAVEQQQAGRWTRGDVVRIRLELDAQSDMSWVVVDDPVPAGSTILGGGLGGRGSLLAADDSSEGWAWLAYEERRFDAYRAYYRFVPKGKWSVEYSVRLNNPGEFLLPATRVEALYAPEMFGELPNPLFTVDASPTSAAAQ